MTENDRNQEIIDFLTNIKKDHYYMAEFRLKAIETTIDTLYIVKNKQQNHDPA